MDTVHPSSRDDDAAQLPEHLKQIVHALERQRDALREQADRLCAVLNYSAEFPAEDADRMDEALAIVRASAELVAAQKLRWKEDGWSDEARNYIAERSNSVSLKRLYAAWAGICLVHTPKEK